MVEIREKVVVQEVVREVVRHVPRAPVKRNPVEYYLLIAGGFLAGLLIGLLF